MSLEDWLKNRWLHGHETSAEEIQALLHSAEEDLCGAEIEGIAAVGAPANLGRKVTNWLRANHPNLLK